MNSVGRTLTRHLPVALYCVVGLGWLFQGARYLSAAELMPYHMAVLEIEWGSLDAAHQTLFLGLLKGFGAGSFGVGLTILLLALIPLRAGNRWARWATPAVAGSYTAALVYVTGFALLPGATPIAVTITLLAMIIVAAACSCFANDSSSS